MGLAIADLDEAPATAPSRVCLCGCLRPVEGRSGPGRPAEYASLECRAKADNQRDRDRRAAERASLDGYLTRAVRHGWLEHKQTPAKELPADYRTTLALAVEIDLFHGPAADYPDDPRLAAFTKGVCEIIRKGTQPPEVKVLDVIPDKRMAVVAFDDSAADQLARLFEMRDRLRQQPSWMAGAAWDDQGTAVPAVDLYGNPVTLYAPPGPGFRTPVPVRDDSYGTCMEFYDRDPRRPYRAPYSGLAWNHGPEAIADHIAPALASYVADAT